jgi:CHASE2 domain
MTSASHHGDPHSTEHWLMRRLRQFWLVIPLVGILGALMMSDLGDFMGVSPLDASNPCAFTDAPQSSISARLYLPIAKWALRYTPSPSVAIIYIDPAHDPPDLITDVCASRAFLARLVTDLNALAAHVIVIDKYYSATACAEPDKNAAFKAAMESSKIPIVVGQQTHALAGGTSTSGCLAPTKRFEFSPASKVHYGLTRIDGSNDLKIPLRFAVFSDPVDSGTTQPVSQPAGSNPTPAPKQLPDASGDTLALAAAKIVNPHIESNPTLRKLLAANPVVDPYTTFLNLPNITALTALCSAESSPRADIDGQPGDQLCKPWIRDPDNLDGKQLSLASKIVVIGDISDQDMRPFPSDLAPFPPGMRPGVFLQANYVQALLDHRFLLEIPTPITLALLVLYVLIVYCLYWAHDENGNPRFTLEQAGFFSLVVLAGVVLCSFLLLVSLSYFTPLWALWGAGVFMVFRYLEASGHHRSQHLLGHLTGHHHAATQPSPEPVPAANESDQTKQS